MFVFRFVVVLMSREFVDVEIGFLWDMLIVGGDYEFIFRVNGIFVGGGVRLFLYVVVVVLVSMCL